LKSFKKAYVDFKMDLMILLPRKRPLPEPGRRRGLESEKEQLETAYTRKTLIVV